ncbi:MAG: DUF2914 domain-containing protein [Deltaproteobacteria bacterium]|jgi:hypothetical protein|nr:DUF2914 domain-containing protein [Deltaproteobacteria bacterium]
MKTKALSMIFFLFALPGVLIAQENAGISIEDIQIAVSIENKEPSEAGESFAADVGRLYCFTRVRTEQEETAVYHVWLFNDRVMAKIELPVKGKTWRTWSVKNILPMHTGKWRVDVESSEGTLLASREFEIK